MNVSDAATLLVAATMLGAADAPTVRGVVTRAADSIGDASLTSSELAGPAQYDVSGWSSWEKVNPHRFFSESHSKSWIDVFVPTDRADTYVNGWAVPIGTEIVVAQYQSARARQPENLAVMVKLRRGWFWGVYAPSGKLVREQGRIQRCIDCHSKAGSDWLFRHVSAPTR